MFPIPTKKDIKKLKPGDGDRFIDLGEVAFPCTPSAKRHHQSRRRKRPTISHSSDLHSLVAQSHRNTTRLELSYGARFNLERTFFSLFAFKGGSHAFLLLKNT